MTPSQVDPKSTPTSTAAAGRLSSAALSDPELRRIKAAYSKRKREFRYTFFEPATLLACQERERTILAILARAGVVSLQKSRILEVGCGAGFWLREFVRWGAQPENIHGIDLLPERISEAKRLCPPGINVECGSATRLKRADGEFDLIMQSTMFSSIQDNQMKIEIAREMLRVLQPDGIILWYDLRVDNPWNSDVRGIRAKEVRSLFPNCRVNFQKLTLAPPIARLVARISSTLHHALASIGPLRTHYLAVISRT